MNPIARRRWQYFKSNRRSYLSLWIFSLLFFLTLGAEFIANDKPLFVSYENRWYFPIFKVYPETTFQGDFETEADYRDPFIHKKIQEKGWMIWPFIKYGYNSINYASIKPAPAAPSFDNLLGTDDQGRDVLARLIYGFRTSLLFGIALTLGSSVIGVIAGGLQGYFAGKFDLIFQRLIEIWSGLPILYLLIILGSFIEPNFWWLLGLMLLFNWMTLVGVVRAEFLKVRNFEYVRAAQALGVSTPVIMLRHILPNAMVAILTYLPFILNGAIITLTSLDFLGFGLPPGSASLGELLAQGKNNLQAPWLGSTAFISIGLTLSLLIFIGEGVRDAFDSRKVRHKIKK